MSFSITPFPDVATWTVTPQAAESLNWKQEGWKLVLSLGLLCLSALFSGLNIGLLGLDATSLRVVSTSGPVGDRESAQRILPIRENTNLLLCTLLIGNVVVNSLMAILLAEISGGVLGLLLTTTFITIFGEIVPQATCTRYALKIGGLSIPIVRFFIFVLYPVAKPISLVLDLVLGKNVGQIYDRNELMKLLEMHTDIIDREMDVHQTELTLMQGALEFTDTVVAEVMTPIADVFSLDVETVLNEETLTRIWQTGHSRIPVYEKTIDNILGLLLVKDLILLNTEECPVVYSLLQSYCRPVHTVSESTSLPAMLQYFKTGKGHMAIVQRVATDGPGDPYYETCGLITLEDVLEQLIKDEIVDEADQYVHVERKDRAVNKRNLMPINTFRYKKFHRLGPTESAAIAAYLTIASEPFCVLQKAELADMLHEAKLVHFSTPHASNAGESSPTGIMSPLSPGIGSPADVWVYVKGTRSDVCTVILSGKFEVVSAIDRFRTELCFWTVLNEQALVVDNHIPDFSCRVIKAGYCLQISRQLYKQYLDRTRSLRPNLLPAPVVTVDVVDDDEPLLQE
eukprot:TRINITY_DN82584_c0_g1_i1.p1 TRINITY_DN82584_c0_g1~~TRINITY_DN82584_c0_g1_i1.p1  ORF type:complete len:569 (+),score=93.35 TRINITY_DN82584_c0_g1_i1:28-1734(+)